MDQSLNNLSAEELGRLFPIRLSAYNPEWPNMFRAERERLLGAAKSEAICGIYHIGSTAVPGLAAKPVVDILMAVPEGADPKKLIGLVEKAGYAFAPQQRKPAPHMMFMRGYGRTGYAGQAYHVHIRYEGVQDEILFRDWLRAHPRDMQRYARLKERLARKFEFDREGYTDAKTAFIRRILKKSKAAQKH